MPYLHLLTFLNNEQNREVEMSRVLVSVSPKSFGQSDVFLRYVMLAMISILEVLTRSDMLKYLIYTEEFLVQLWIVLKNIR